MSAVVDYQQGLTKAGLLDEALAALRWGASYLMACHPQPNVFMAVQGNHSLDFHYYVGATFRRGRMSMHIAETAHDRPLLPAGPAGKLRGLGARRTRCVCIAT